MSIPDLSFIIPAKNEENNIEALYLELSKVLKRLNKTYEIIFIDDGSQDSTFEIAKKLSENNRELE